MSAWVDGDGSIRGASVEQRERWESDLARRLQDLTGTELDAAEALAQEITERWIDDVRVEVGCGHPGAAQA